MGVVVAASLIVGVCVLAIVRKKFCVKYGNKSFLMNVGYYLYSNTKLGRWYFRRELAKARCKLNGIPHSHTTSVSFNGVVIHPIPFAESNYCYLVTDEQDAVSILIDPADPEAIQPILDTKHIIPAAILSTHKHWDHSAGNEEWRKRYPRIKVFGGIAESVPAVTDRVADGDRLTFGRLHITALMTPGHTSGHVVYVLDGLGAPSSLFSGDLLFVGGAGKMFEGKAETMLKSLDTICSLPNDTMLWPGHEYSLSNLRFASHLEPHNASVQAKLTEAEEKQRLRQSVIPSTIEAEKSYNPFLRTREPRLLSSLKIEMETTGVVSDQVRAAALAECRARKDNFKYNG